MKNIIVFILVIAVNINIIASKPKIAPTISIWGKLIEFKVNDNENYLSVLTEFIDGYPVNDTVTIKIKPTDHKLVVGKTYFLSFSFTSKENECWALTTSHHSFETYKTLHKNQYTSDLRIWTANDKLMPGSNSIFLLIRNNSGNVRDITIKEIKLINAEAMSSLWGNDQLTLSQKLEEAEIHNYRVDIKNTDIKILPHMMQTYQFDLFVCDNYKVDVTYTAKKENSSAKSGKTKSTSNALYLWCDFQFVDELGNEVHTYEDPEKFGVVPIVMQIIEKQTEY